MLSTYLNYKLINKDMRQSLNRVADQAITARETKYYKENIGKISSVNEFLANHRLYKFAMEAHGLDDMIYAKAFMRKVLESDLNDKNSFANRLSDERYRTFAQAFQGLNVGSSSKPDLQTDRQEDDLIGLYDQQIVNRGNAVRDDTAYYTSALAKIKNVDEFVADRKLVDYALKAVGIDPTYYSAQTMKLILTSNPADPGSYINSLKGSASPSLVQTLLSLRASFNFTDTGALPPGTPAQTADQIKSITEAYVFTVPNRLTPLGAEWNTEYFRNTAAAIASVTQLLSDSRMLSYIQTAFGIETSATSKDDIAKALTSDLADPLSFANQSNNEAYRKLARLFNFQSDGQVPAGQPMLGDRELTEVTATYMAAYDDIDQEKDSDKAAFYRNQINLVKNVDDLMKNVILYDYVLEAYGLDPNTESKSVIRQVLTSDLSNRDSFANRSRDSRYIGLAGAFNFGPDGKPRYARVAQSESEITATARAYLASATDRRQTVDQAKAETLYYREKIDRVSSLSDLLKDKRLLTYVATAFGVTVPSSPSDFMERLMKSNLDDPKSFANSLKDSRFAQMAASFNFAMDGTIAPNPLQSRRDILNTIELHTRQTLEKQSGEDNEGVRLALYFQRKAPEISSVYSILADRALQQVVFKALSLPDELAQAPVDRQAAVLKGRVKIEDFKDPQKLEKFLSRFSAMYDIANSDSAPSLVSTLFQGNGSADVGIGAMVTMARLRASRYL